MNPILEKRDGSYIVGGPKAGQPEYEPLEVIRGTDGARWSAWSASWKDLFRMLRGDPVRISILSKSQPPIYVTTDTPLR